MGLLVLAAGAAVTILLPLTVLIRRGRRWLAVGRDVAQPLGLSFEKNTWTGTVHGHQVELSWAAPKRASGVRIVVELRPGADLLRFWPVGVTVPDAQPVSSGDPAFDAVVRVDGVEGLLRARLHRTTRRALLDVFEQQVAFDGRRFEWVIAGAPDPRQVEPALQLLIGLADRLSAPLDVAALADTALHDAPAVALAALRCLPPGATRDATDAAILADPRDARALIAARRADDGLLVDRLTRWIQQPGSDTFRAAALRALAAHTDATASARRCLDADSGPESIRTALLLLAEANPPVELARLAALIQSHVAADAALWLARRHGHAAEPLHISCLVHPEPAARHAAADGLAYIGSTAALEPLERFMRRARDDASLLDAGRRARAAIVARQTATAGRLTVVDPPATGGLSQV